MSQPGLAAAVMHGNAADVAPGLQQLEGDMEKEQGAVPGGWPGVYGCDYKNLTRVMVHMAKARVAFARKNFTTAEVRQLLFCAFPAKLARRLTGCVALVQAELRTGAGIEDLGSYMVDA